ncbi:MAG TPA: DUF899 family protein [Steroidobacteraceae bacterium]|nr:DUF899 family protein [Steroidobacteraceae bacterium]
MSDHRIVAHEEWLAARRRLLAREKELQRLRDELSSERRALPWERVGKSYVFEGERGRETLADLFGAHSQLIVYHFMFAPDWDTGCKSCSFWADNYNGVVAHLAQRDTALVAISRAPWPKLRAFAARLGWTFKWVSSGSGDFNYDYGVSFRPEDVARGAASYNYAPYSGSTTDLPGFSVFCRDASGAIFHTYSTYARGLDPMNAAYQMLDLVPKGRDEAGLPHSMSWVRLHDQYGT